MKKTAALLLFISLFLIQVTAYCQKGKEEAADLLQVIKTQVQKKMVDSAMANTIYLLDHLKPDNATKTEGRQIAQTIYDTLVNEAERKLNSGYITLAVAKYQKASNFCTSIGDVCTDKGQAGLVSAKTAMYNDIIAKARIELENDNLTDAEILANKAKTYASQNPGAIKSSSGADDVLTGIRQKYYKRYLMKVKEAMETKHYNTALIRLQEADTFLKNNAMNRDANYFQLLKAASKPVIAAYIDKANGSKDNLTKARQYYHSADSLASLSGLNEGHMKDELEALGKAVQNNDCMYWQAAFKNLIAKASAFETDKNFKAALETYSYAVGKKDSIPGCHVDFQLAEKKVTELKPAADYQNLMAASTQDGKDNKFPASILEYDSAENILIRDSLSKYNLTAKSTYNFVLEHSDADFLIAGAEFFSNANTPDKALNLLKEALKAGYQPSTKELQHVIATQLAESDFKTQPNENPKKLADQYCGEDDKLSVLKKAYLKAWKGMK